ncbi:MAG: DUF2769 domain-containing protein [Candidatus Bathyarchaeia archaeon]|jgi:hypothetical protein
MGNPVPDNPQNVKLCICPTCPTYKKSGLTGILYCAKDKAAEKVVTVNCICPNCPIYKQYGLDQLYYCAQGKSADIK